MVRKKKGKVRRTPSGRLTLWDRKMDASTYSAILPRVKPLAIKDVRMYQVAHEDLITLVKSVIMKYGTEYVRIYGYLSYAEKIWKAKQHFSSKALQLEADAQFLYWLARGYYEDILREIAKKLGVEISSWSILLERIGLAEEVIYKGTKRALQETLHGVEVNLTDTQIEYDPQGNPVKITTKDIVTGKTKIIHLEYDAQGNVVRIWEEWA